MTEPGAEPETGPSNGPLPRQGDVVQLEVGPVAHGGHCVARLEGRVVFVRHALPGETVRARLTETGGKRAFWRADAIEVLVAAPGRVESRCTLSGPGGCGGCDWQHADLATQRELKHAVVTEQLQRLGRVETGPGTGLEFAVEALPEVAGADGPGLGWRTRVQFAVDAEGRPGLRQHRSHTVVAVPHCPIAHPAVDATGIGGQRLRGVSAVEVVARAEALVVLEPSEGAGRRVRAPQVPDGTGVAVRGPEGLERLRGRTWVREEVVVGGVVRPFRVTGAGFWQVHPAAAQTLLDAVLAEAAPRPGESALDLYAGVGLFSAGLAVAVGAQGAVAAVEGDPRAVSDARRNLHDLPQARCVGGRVDEQLDDAVAQVGGSVDVVVLDPPRTGAGPALVRRLAALEPRVVVYVACDPAALARDVAAAAEVGYRLRGVRAFDAFPMTQHVECVATLVADDGSPADALS